MKRLAVYFAPRPGAFAERAAAWLGWDCATGQPVPHPDLPGLPRPAADLTRDPRKYGFHGTLRAPFRLAEAVELSAVQARMAAVAAGLPPVLCEGLVLQTVQGFLALTPLGCEAAVMDLAARVVEGTDDLRAPLTEAEVARRRPETLSSRQRALLDRWGYPFVMDEFRFHLTLTDRLPPDEAAQVQAILAAHVAPVLPRPFVIEDLCLFGEDENGRFHLLHRYALTG